MFFSVFPLFLIKEPPPLSSTPCLSPHLPPSPSPSLSLSLSVYLFIAYKLIGKIYSFLLSIDF